MELKIGNLVCRRQPKVIQNQLDDLSPKKAKVFTQNIQIVLHPFGKPPNSTSANK